MMLILIAVEPPQKRRKIELVGVNGLAPVSTYPLVKTTIKGFCSYLVERIALFLLIFQAGKG